MEPDLGKRISKILSDAVASIIHFVNPGLEPELRVSMPNLYDQIRSKLREMEEWYWLIDAFIDDNTKQIYLIAVKDGLLFKADVTVDPSGVTIGVFNQVIEIFQPVSQNRFLIKRMTDGTSRWFMIASTAVLNRNGAIDSTILFDNMIKRCMDTEQYPFLAFCHQVNLKMGTTDWMSREGFLLLASGIYNDTELSDAMQKAYAADPEYWGSSISFWPIEGHMEEIAKDVEVPVYTDGEFEEITIAPKEIACCILTALKSKERIADMDERTKNAILKLAGDDKELAEKFIAMADEANEQIVQQDMVRRTTVETPAPAKSTEIPPTEGIAPVTEPVVEEIHSVIVDDAVVETILVKADIAGKIAEGIAEVTEQFKIVVDDLKKLTQEFADFRSATQSSSNKFTEMVEQIKKVQEQAKTELDNDMPRHVQTRVTYRPSGKTQSSSTTEDVMKPADIAEQTLANIK